MTSQCPFCGEDAWRLRSRIGHMERYLCDACGRELTSTAIYPDEIQKLEEIALQTVKVVLVLTDTPSNHDIAQLRKRFPELQSQSLMKLVAQVKASGQVEIGYYSPERLAELRSLAVEVGATIEISRHEGSSNL